MAEKPRPSSIPARKPVPAPNAAATAPPPPTTTAATTTTASTHDTHASPFDSGSKSGGGFSGLKASYMAFLDRHVPRHKRYLGLQRRAFLLLLLGLVVAALLALIIGLAVGLTVGKGAKFLPLPGDKKSFTGELTYYGTGLGACGVTSSDSDSIVSVSHFLFDHEQHGSDPNANPLCGRKIRATRFNEAAGGKRSVDLTVVDRCTGCQPTDLDVSMAVFKRLADVDDGRVDVTWAWLSEEPA